ncbi:MAG: hypothetical protein RL711_358 [Bacteroidota bacterium]
MKKNSSLTVLLWIISLVTVVAQQDPQYSQYMFNTLALNPAYAGSRDVLNLTLLHRNQWNGIDGGPRSTTISGDMPLLNEKVGIGALVFTDYIGADKNTGVYVSYAQRIRLSNAGTLSLGGTLGGSLYNADLTSIDLYGNTYDQAFSSNVNKFLPNLGLGIYYATDKWYTGVSMPRLYDNNLYKNEKLQINASQARHYFVMAGFVKRVNPIVVVKPSLMFKAVAGAPLQTDLNLNCWFYDKLSLGVSYRTLDAVVALIEISPIQGFKIGYAYDYTTTSLKNSITKGSHEIMLRYEFATSHASIITPRYF